jgi:hypothetical protein
MWQTFLTNLIPMVFVVITPVFTLLVGVLLHKLAKKWKIEGALQYDDKVDELIMKGIKAVENRSLAAVKRGGDMTPGQKKLDDAMKFVNAQLIAMQFPKKAADELSMLIEAKLFDGAKKKEIAGVYVDKPDEAASRITPTQTITQPTAPAAV